MQKRVLTLFIIGILTLQYKPGLNAIVENVRLGPPDEGEKTHMVYIDLKWEQSWHLSLLPANWDAAWVFIKYKTPNNTWRHAKLSQEKNQHAIPVGAAIDVYSEGALIYSKNTGYGPISFQDLGLKWEYAFEKKDWEPVEIRVFAVEMVYIPEGNFFLGDRRSKGRFHPAEDPYIPALVSFEPIKIKCQNTVFDDMLIEDHGLWIDGDDGVQVKKDSSVVNTEYPIGYHAFYMMKHELTQGQYAEFLNCLQPAQALLRYPDKFGHEGFRIKQKTDGTYHSDSPDRPCNFLSWQDGCAWADWAGLRPMTETEYEKASRGSMPAINEEFAWGGQNYTAVKNIIRKDGGPISQPKDANIHVNDLLIYKERNLAQPVEPSFFTKAEMFSRLETGRSFYGIGELSGNLWERCVTLGRKQGRQYKGSHGDGQLSYRGYANQTDWPGHFQGEVIDALGSGYRGGSYLTTPLQARTSDRYNACHANVYREAGFGFRAVHSAK